MGLYTNKARLIFLYDAHKVTDAEKLRGHVDAIIGYAGKGTTAALKFADWYEVAKALGVPFIGYVETKVEPCIEWTWNPPNEHFPNEQNDPLAQMVYRQTKYPNGQQRLVSAWIIDGSDEFNSRGEPLPDVWRAGIFGHEMDRVYKRMRKPVYPLIKKPALKSAGVSLRTFLENQEGISTYEPALSPEFTSWGLHYVPGDNDAPRPPYAPAWNFWWYGSANLDGIEGGVPLMIYNGTAAELYAALAFTPPVTPPVTPPPVTPPPDDPPPDDTTDDTIAELRKQTALLVEIRDLLKQPRGYVVSGTFTQGQG